MRCASISGVMSAYRSAESSSMIDGASASVNAFSFPLKCRNSAWKRSESWRIRVTEYAPSSKAHA